VPAPVADESELVVEVKTGAVDGTEAVGVGQIEVVGGAEVEGQIEVVGGAEVEGQTEVAGETEVEGQTEVVVGIEVEGRTEVAGEKTY